MMILCIMLLILFSVRVSWLTAGQVSLALRAKSEKSQMHCEPMFLQDPDGYCTVHCNMCGEWVFLLFLAGEIIQKPFLMLETSELLLLSQTTFKLTHPLRPTCFQVSYTSRHCTIQRRVGWMASSTYFRTLQGWAVLLLGDALETAWLFHLPNWVREILYIHRWSFFSPW